VAAKNGYDGRLMENSTIQVNMCCILHVSLIPKLFWIVVIKLLPLTYNHSHFWASLGFHIFLIMASWDCTFFLLLGYFGLLSP